MVNVVVSGVPVGANTRCLQAECADRLSVSSLVGMLAADTQLPSSSLMLLHGGRVVGHDHFVPTQDASTIFFEMRLCGAVRGGKGGFGANLRGANASKKTTDFGACRDLSGRRLRDVDRERAAAERAAAERAAAAQRVALAPSAPVHCAEPEAPEALEDVQKDVDLEALEEDMEECKSNVESAVAEGLRASRALRKKQAKMAKAGRKRYRRDAGKSSEDDAGGKRMKRGRDSNVVVA